MKKLIVFIVVSMLCLSVVGCSDVDSYSLEAHYNEKKGKYVFRLVHEEITISAQGEYAVRFAELMEEKSGGKIEIEIYPVGQIGDALQQAELLQVGGVDFAIISPGSIGSLVPESNIFALQFMFTDDMNINMRILKESKAINELLNDSYLKRDIKVLGYWQEGFMQWTSDRLLDTPESFENLKIRVMQSPILLASYEAYGANPIPMSAMEVYSALQLKMINAQENPIFVIDERKFAEVQEYIIYSSASLYVTSICVNPKFFDSLPKEYQDLVLEVVDEMHDESLLIEQSFNNVAEEKIIAADTGVKFVTLTSEQREVFKEPAQVAYKKYVEMYGDDAKEILDLLVEEVKQISGNTN